MHSDKKRLKVKKLEKINHVNSNKRESQMALIISDKKNASRDLLSRYLFHREKLLSSLKLKQRYDRCSCSISYFQAQFSPEFSTAYNPHSPQAMPSPFCVQATLETGSGDSLPFWGRDWWSNIFSLALNWVPLQWLGCDLSISCRYIGMPWAKL